MSDLANASGENLQVKSILFILASHEAFIMSIWFMISVTKKKSVETENFNVEKSH